MFRIDGALLGSCPEYEEVDAHAHAHANLFRGLG